MFSCFEPRSSIQPLRSASKRKLEVKDDNFSNSVSRQLKDIMVRIVHAGGRIEMYHNPLPVFELIQKYPGLCITTPDVFKQPHESVLSPHDILLPGRKYLLMRSTSLEKLKHKHSTQTRDSAPSLTAQQIEDMCLEDSISSARDFFISKERRSSFGMKKPIKEKRPFVPPIQRPRLRREHDWEPSLTSIQELSP